MSTSEQIFITGACGMVGSHLVEYYFAKGIKPIGTVHNATIDIKEIEAKSNLINCDVRDAAKVFNIINANRPSIIYHLAAQSYPTVSWLKPIETMDINSNGTINVFEAIKQIRVTDKAYNPMVVVACSSAEYGASLTPENAPVSEKTELLPLHPYGVSKVAQDLLSYQYYQNDGIRCIRARIFNTTGTRKVNDVTSDFTKRAIQIERGEVEVFNVGNLKSKRSIADVRDLVSALVLLAEKGIAGEAYNISGSTVYEVSFVLSEIEKIIGKKLPVQQDKSLLRSTDEPVIFGDSAKLIKDTGWQQKIALQQTLNDMLDYWRWKLAK
jgi:GDP-4-dehydro-6-deoxy-D-mannose reductase